MKKLSLLLVISITYVTSYSQLVVNVEPGMSVSRQSFIYSSTMLGISGFAGVEYLDIEITREINMNLSSNIGYIQKGGNFKNPNGSNMFGDLGFEEASMKLNYISINTTADFKYPINKVVIPFIGIGPYLDILLSNTDITKQFYEIEKPGTLGFGALVNLGVKYIYDDLQFGFKFDYFFGINKTSAWLGRDMRPNSFGIGLLAGYRFK